MREQRPQQPQPWAAFSARKAAEVALIGTSISPGRKVNSSSQSLRGPRRCFCTAVHFFSTATCPAQSCNLRLRAERSPALCRIIASPSTAGPDERAVHDAYVRGAFSLRAARAPLVAVQKLLIVLATPCLLSPARTILLEHARKWLKTGILTAVGSPVA